MITAQLKNRKRKDGSVVQHVYYHCTRKSTKIKCAQNKVIREDVLEQELYSLLDSFTIHPKFEEWGLEAIKQMNEQEAKDRVMAENSQHRALEDARKRYDKLVDMMTKDLIKEDAFKQKSEALDAEIKDLEQAVGQTNDRADKWREGLEKTLDILAHGRDRFENGGVVEKRDVLLALGTSPTILDGKLGLDVHEWLIPVQQKLPKLNEQYSKVKPNEKDPNNRGHNSSLNAVRLEWQG